MLVYGTSKYATLIITLDPRNTESLKHFNEIMEIIKNTAQNYQIEHENNGYIKITGKYTSLDLEVVEELYRIKELINKKDPQI